MSRRDAYHELVKQALIHDGWTITHDPYFFDADPELSTDLGAERAIAAEKDNEKIAVEVKSFLRSSQVVDLERAIGQYILYEAFLQKQEPDRLLYLAVPLHAYTDIFAREVGRVAIERLKMRLIVFALDEGSELQWQLP